MLARPWAGARRAGAPARGGDQMTKRIVLGLAAAGLAACVSDGLIASAEPPRMTALQASQMEIGGRLSVARFDDDGQLIYPEDIDA